MEVAGLAIGAVPLIVEVVKAYRSTYEKILVFRRRAHEV